MILSLIGTVIAFAMAFRYYKWAIYCLDNYRHLKTNPEIIFSAIALLFLAIAACFSVDFLLGFTKLFNSKGW